MAAGALAAAAFRASRAFISVTVRVYVQYEGMSPEALAASNETKNARTTLQLLFYLPGGEGACG